MAISTRTVSIFGSLILAVFLIAGAYVLSSPQGILVADAGLAEELLEAYAQKDTDADGLPDWQEAVYGTDPLVSESFRAGVSDADAVAQGLVKPKFESKAPADSNTTKTTLIPTTVTDTFALRFFTQYLTARGSERPSKEAIAQFVSDAMEELIQEARVRVVVPKVTSLTSGTGAQVLTQYASAVDQILTRYTPQKEKGEVLYFSDAFYNNDALAIKNISDIGTAYTNMARALSVLVVPEEIHASHTRLVDAFARVGSALTDIGTVRTDQLRAYVGLALYEEASEVVVATLSGMGSVYSAESVVIKQGSAGMFFYDLMMYALKSSNP